VLIDGWGWCWEDESGREGGVEVEEVELRTFNEVNISCDHVHA
jgi:hypothetical protein